MRDWLPQNSTSIAKEVKDMKMKDLVDLVRAGLKPAEIKEMIELEKQVGDINIDEPEEVEQPKEETEVKQEPEVDTVSEELKQAKEDLANLKAQLTTLQQENKNKDISQNLDKSLDEQIEDIFSKLF